MRVEKRDGSIERRIITGMVVDPIVCGRIATKWEIGLFKSPWANIVASLCAKHFSKYQKAPGKDIQLLVENWANAKERDEDTVRLVERFLRSLSDEYEQLAHESNPDLILDEAQKYLNLVRATKLNSAVEEAVEANDPETAIELIEKFGKVEIGGGAGIDVLQDDEAVKKAFETKQEPLISLAGAAGEFFGDSLERDGFIALEGAEKKGKTVVLLDLCWLGMLQRRKVAVFEVGDMSQDQIMRRFMVRASGRPLFPARINYPLSITRAPEEKQADIRYEQREFSKPLSWQKARRACLDILENRVKTNETLLRLSCHPSDSINVQGIRSILQSWERDGWFPDVVAVDYPDLLAAPSGAELGRDQINKTWKQLRGLSQSLHCLVLAPTQTDAASYEIETLGMSNFSEDKRKRAHTTGTIGINQTEEENDAGVYRFNWIFRREAKISRNKCVYVAGCRELCRIFVRSCW